MPNNALNKPFAVDLPARLEISVKAKSVTPKYSHGPKRIVSAARGFEMTTIAAILKTVPINELNIPTPSALPASPFSASGLPSNVVAIEAGVPGIFSKIAETNPPDVPPI